MGRVIDMLPGNVLLRLTVQVGEAVFLVELPREVGDEMEVVAKAFMVIDLPQKRWSES